MSIGAHLGRMAHKGANYELAEYQDGIYYYAMSYNVFKNPISLSEELESIKDLDVAAESTTRYIIDNSEIFHPENGLSHSAPYAYRVLQPILVHFLALTGLSHQLGFLMISSIALGMLGVFLYLLLRRSKISTSLSIICVLCFIFASLNLVQNPILTDQLSLSFLVICIYLERRKAMNLALFISSIAVLNKETNLMIWLYLLVMLIQHRRNPVTTRLTLPFIALPPIVFVLVRMFVTVPNKDYPILDLVFRFWSWNSFLSSFIPLVLLAVFSSPILFMLLTSRKELYNLSDFWLFGIGIVGFCISISLGSNWNRYLLAVWPMFLFYDSLTKIDSRNSLIVLSSFGLLFLGANDFLSFNSSLNMKYIQIFEIIFLIGVNLAIYPKVWKIDSSERV
jgi:hypothetical protein